jgi:glycosyltransferase involved in cell wall biosynthesis
MRPIYARAKVLLALSLWWESFGRVAAEAAMNGIPVIATTRSGIPEAAGQQLIPVELPESFYKPPYAKIPTKAVCQQITNAINESSSEAYNNGRYVTKKCSKKQTLESVGDALVNTLQKKLAR